MSLKDLKEVDTDEPQTILSYAKKNMYAIVIVALIALIAFMFYPGLVLTLFLSLLVPVLLGVTVEMFFQTEYYKSLNYQLSRLEKTAIIGTVVGVTGVSMGYFSENITDHIESLMSF